MKISLLLKIFLIDFFLTVTKSEVAQSLFETPWSVAHQAPLSMEFSSQEYWSGLSFPSPRDLPDSGTEPGSPASAGGFFTTEPPGLPEFIAVCASFKWNHTVFVLCQILCTHSSD